MHHAELPIKAARYHPVSCQSNMRTVAQYRERQLERLPMALRRLGMFCSWYGDLYYRVFLDDLFWIDDRPDSDRKIVDGLLFDPAGVAGKLAEQFPYPPDNFQNEVASVYAQVAFGLRYFHPQRLLTNCEFESLSAALKASFFSVAHTMRKVIDQFGPPSLDVVGGQTTVLWLYRRGERQGVFRLVPMLPSERSGHSYLV